ncbi:hypothetical protein BH11PAT4_BH11PAT4_3870 [soil metagenome]
MNIRYASLLAATKFRTRLGRSIVTVVAASLVASIMLVASFSLTGLENGVTQLSDTKLSKLNLVRENVYSNEPVSADGIPSTEGLPYKNLEEYRIFTKDSGIVEVFQEYSLDPVTFSEPKLKTNPNQDFFGGSSNLNITARTPKLYATYLDENPPAAVEGTVPAVIAQNILLSLADVTFKDSDNASYRISKIREAASAWLGKVVTATQSVTSDQAQTSTKLTIQGFFSSGGLLSSGEYGSIIVPDNALGNLSASTMQKSNVTYFASFPNQEAQVAYASDLSKPPTDFNQKFFRYGSVYGNPLLAFKEIKQTAQSVLTYVVLALLVAVGIAMLTTLAKIISDSERESGVFRAIGAKGQDILQIYVTYSVFISFVAMVVSLIVATALSGYLTNRFAPDLTAQLISLSGSTNTGANISLIGFNFLHLVGVFFAILIASILGTLIPLTKLLRQDPIKALRAD